MNNAKIRLAAHIINIRIDHIKSFSTKEGFIENSISTFKWIGIPEKDLSKAFSETYDIYVAQKEKKTKESSK